MKGLLHKVFTIIIVTNIYYCQAKVQVQSLKLKSKVKSKVLSQRDLDFADTIIIQPPPTHQETLNDQPEDLQSSVIPFWKPLTTLY